MNRQVLERIYTKYEGYIRSKVTTFRCDDNLSQAFFTVYYCLSTGMKWVDNDRATYRRFDIFTDYDRIIRFFMSEHKDLPQMFCLNNNDNEKDIAVMCQFEKIFPDKSQFEI